MAIHQLYYMHHYEESWELMITVMVCIWSIVLNAPDTVPYGIESSIWDHLSVA